MRNAGILALACLFVVTACAHQSALPLAQSPLDANSSDTPRTAMSVTHGNFTEYWIPAGVNPTDLTRGPYDTVYFAAGGNSGGSPNLYQLAVSTGKIHTFKPPSGPGYEGTGFGSIFSSNDSVTYVLKQPVNEDTFYFATVTPDGTYSFVQAPYFEFGILTNFVQVPGTTNFTYGYCIDPCNGPNDGVAAGVNLDDYFVPRAISVAGGNYYVAATCQGPCSSPTDSQVYEISTGGAILNKFPLANGSFPTGIVTGSDHNLLIVENGSNKIARMTQAGVVTEYAIPTANSGADRITYGYDLAQWFTETTANKIARISTTGVITEYKVPTANSQPTGITPCEDSICGSHGGLWFTETAANKIGRFNAPK